MQAYAQGSSPKFRYQIIFDGDHTRLEELNELVPLIPVLETNRAFRNRSSGQQKSDNCPVKVSIQWNRFAKRCFSGPLKGAVTRRRVHQFSHPNITLGVFFCDY
ncbi:hypothetical protein NPIL_99481 [Nephila pilipes]|uniref:Uncharacterized protein n=1 Tax=Nephila pilipes TaxID=299642 RepID=A0A8X6P3K1_NEPPI|nr:hypothetical protein NPIL_99481 [Nephila pilipes]